MLKLCDNKEFCGRNRRLEGEVKEGCLEVYSLENCCC